MRIETWNLKIGDFIETHYILQEKKITEKVQILEGPWEMDLLLVVRWKLQHKDGQHLQGISAFDEDEQCWISKTRSDFY